MNSSALSPPWVFQHKLQPCIFRLSLRTTQLKVFYYHIIYVIHLTTWKVAQLCHVLLYNSFVTISTQRNKAILSHNSLDANMSFQIYPARSSIQKSSSCTAHSSSGQGEHTPAPGFQFLHKHRLQSQVPPVSYTSIPTPITPGYSSVTLSIGNKAADLGSFGYSSKLTPL